jgi:hypothetical protein
MGRPAELADRPTQSSRSRRDQHLGVAGEGRRVAADIGDPRHRRGGELRPARRAGPRRIEHDRVERSSSLVERPAIEVAMLDATPGASRFSASTASRDASAA